MKKLYYVIEKEVQDIDDVQECTGYKDVTVYQITDNEPKRITTLTLENFTDSQEEIFDWLSGNGYGDNVSDEYELVRL
jgi:hypothetical protein